MKAKLCRTPESRDVSKGEEVLTNKEVMDMVQESNSEESALPSAVVQIRKLLVPETPLANPLGLTVLPSKQATLSQNVSQKKTPKETLKCEGKVKQKVKSRKRTSQNRKAENLFNLKKKEEKGSSEEVQRPSFHPFRFVNEGSIVGPNWVRRNNRAKGQHPEKKTRKCEEISINLGGACNKSKKKTEEGISAGENGQKGDEEMVLVTELGVTERY